MTLSHPSYVVSGQQVALTLTIGLKIFNSNISLGVTDVGVEVRQPTVINSTSGVVSSWAVLGSAQLNVNQNFSGSGIVTRAVTVTAAAPSTSGALELLVPTSNVAFNGYVDLNVYQKAGDVTSASPQSVSLLDSVTYYRTQLSTLALTSSWVTYQLLAAVAGLALFVRFRPSYLGVPTDSYSLGLKSFRVERSLAHLDDMLKSGMIGQQRYEELKQGFVKELDRLRGGESRP